MAVRNGRNGRINLVCDCRADRTLKEAEDVKPWLGSTIFDELSNAIAEPLDIVVEVVMVASMSIELVEQLGQINDATLLRIYDP